MTTWINTTAAITAIQTYSLLLFCAHLFPQRFRLPVKPVLFLVLDFAGCFAIELLCRFVNDSHMAFSFSYTVIVQFLLCLALFKGNPFYEFFYILFTNVYYAAVLMIAVFAKDALLPPGALPTRFLYGLFVNIIPQVVAILALIPLQHYTIQRDFDLSPPAFYWISADLIYVALYFGIIYSFDVLMRRRLVTGLSVLMQAALLAVCVAVYIMFLNLCQGYQEKLRYTLMQKQYDLQKAHFAEIQASNQALRELRHEMKNYVFYMNYLIDRGDYDQLRRFFSDFYQREYHNLFEVSAADSFLEVVLQQKVAMARAKGIQVDANVLMPRKTGIDDLDLCVILSNLMDNAVEACAGIDGASINLRLKAVKRYLSIVIENTAGADVLKQNPHLKSVKQDKELHGIGLRVIRQVIKRYDGTVEFESDTKQFRALLMLRMPETTESEEIP